MFTERTVIPEIPGVNEAYLGLIPARQLVEIVSEGGEIFKSLFYDNVRDFQDYNAVNSEIKKTLESSERNRFALMNNGVTIIAKTLRATGNKFLIEDFQVVNGCQTCHVLFDQRDLLDDMVLVPFRLIATSDETITTAIIKATNRQTEVRQEQLLALSDFGKKLELYLSSYPPDRRLFYERRSRQYNNITSIEKTRIITPSNLIRSYASMFLEGPHRTTRNYAALLGEIGKDIFGKDHRIEPYYVAALALYRLEYLFRSQSLDPKYKPARFHILFAAFLIATNGQKLPPMNSHDMKRLCEILMEVLWDVTSADEIFKKAAQAVERVADGNFHRDHIRTQPFTETLKKEAFLMLPS